MRIVVYYLSAEDKGGLYVLHRFYQDAVHCGRSDIAWFFIVSIDSFADTEHVKIIKFAKGNALQRLIFENTKLSHIVNDLNPDLIISLQNMSVRGCKQPQYVYLHQSLQYCPKRFSFLKSAERNLAVRQRLICEMYRQALPRAIHIFVQTEWIKQATKAWIKKDNITVVPVRIDPSAVPVRPYSGQDSRTFFYPTRPEIYKNNEVIIEACKKLAEWGITDYRVVLTISPEENAYAAGLYEKAKGLPVEMIGSVPYEKMWEWYGKSILLFSSYLETCGLPLVEARAAKARILASDLPFSHEALDGYPNANFFQYDDANDLAARMKDDLEHPRYTDVLQESGGKQKNLCDEMLRMFEGSP